MNFRKCMLAFTAGAAFAIASSSLAQEQLTDTSDWREEYAYTLGVQAYTYAYPLIKMSELRYDWTNNPDASFYAALNHFHHKKELADHINYTTGGSPNQDTLYSWGWMDLRDGPVVLTHPDMGERYFIFEIADFHSDNFANVSQLATGSDASSHAILPPGWTGTLPSDIDGSFQSPTDFVLIFGRTLVSGQDDVPAVNELQDQYHMIPLSLWGQENPGLPEKRDVFEPYDAADDPLAPWRTINRAWSENPVDRDQELVQLFAEIGVGPGFSAASLDLLPEPIQSGLARAADTAGPMIAEMLATGAYKSKIVNGWNYPPTTMGRAGLAGDFVTRAAIQSYGGMIANDPVEAVYLNTFVDANGDPLQGGKAYTVKFDPDGPPPTKAFFSLTMYGPDTNFVANDIKRYSVGDRTEGLVTGDDGMITIYVQPDEPTDPDKRANWLPSPQDGNFYFVLRTYQPEQPIIDQTWAPPAVNPAQ